jgi:hypothetical protein
MTNETEPESPPDKHDEAPDRAPARPASFWRSPAFAVVAALIALIGAVWRCA